MMPERNGFSGFVYVFSGFFGEIVCGRISAMELLRNSVFEYIKKKYSVSPEYPWKRDNTSAVFRHSDNNKWFALVMEVGKDKLGSADTGERSSGSWRK